MPRDIMAEVARISGMHRISSRAASHVKMEFTYARSATERAEDARLVTLRRSKSNASRKRKMRSAGQKEAAQSQVQASNAAGGGRRGRQRRRLRQRLLRQG